MIAVELCEGCGAEVVPGREQDTGEPAVFERLMVRVGGELLLKEHLCRDYIAWHQPADPRDPWDLELPPLDWRMRVRQRVAERLPWAA